MWPLRSVPLVAPLALGAGIAFCGLISLGVRVAHELATMAIEGPGSVEVSPRHALTLDIVDTDASCRYYSSFDVQAVVVDEGDRHVELQRTFEFEDGCTWRSFETLDRVPGSNQFTYGYREAPLSCPAHAIPAPSCRRDGFASMDP